MRKSQKPDERAAQSARFIETARALDADEDETSFKAKLAVIAKQKPKVDREPSEDTS
jgi:hypothetical protein